MPGRRKSCTKAAPPVILAGMSMRGADLPTILCCAVRFRGEFTVTDLAAVRRMDDAIRDLERVSGGAELLGGEVNEQGAHLGARHAQRGAALLDRLATGGLPLIRSPAGVARDHRDAPQRHLELLGSDLGERRHDALP